MAEKEESLSVGKVKQYQGPFQSGDIIRFKSDTGYKLGISIGEKDFMSFEGIDREKSESIPIVINGKEIQIGRTFMYEPGVLLTDLILSFPKGCPQSTLIEITAMEKPVE